jgi:hypothetical protein|uniref:Uncharacterized protein n=1 Tax=Fagus sylvatica TaxID=28930 RepID=A0A2N9ICJ8_FAGSY
MSNTGSWCTSTSEREMVARARAHRFTSNPDLGRLRSQIQAPIADPSSSPTVKPPLNPTVNIIATARSSPAIHTSPFRSLRPPWRVLASLRTYRTLYGTSTSVPQIQASIANPSSDQPRAQPRVPPRRPQPRAPIQARVPPSPSTTSSPTALWRD